MAKVRPVTDTLREVRQGALLDEADQAFHQLIEDCMLSRKAGKLTITLKLNPPKTGDDIMHVIGEVAATKPVTPAQTLFFKDTHGNLVSRDPRQPDFGFGGVNEAEQDSTEAKEA